MLKRTTCLALVAMVGLFWTIGCSDDTGPNPPPGDGSQLQDGGIVPDTVAKPDTLPPIPPGCEAKCIAEAKYKCVTKQSSGSCVACLTNAHCTANPWSFGPTCSSTNKCTCKADPDCANNNNGAKCKTSLGRCYCETDADCSGGLKCIGKYISTKICAKPCSSNFDCTDPTKPACDTATGKCVECLKNTDCAGALYGGHCDTSDNTCTCKTDADCKGGYGWGNKCDTKSSKRCVCTADAECNGNPNGPTCHTTFKKCTCKNDGECGGTYSKCYVPYKGASYNHCQKPCKVDGDCPSGLNCDGTTGKCIECTKDADCTGTYKFCLQSKGKCVKCKADKDCTSSTYKYCLPAEGKCVKCKSNADCSGTKPVCDVASGSCIECKNNTDCKNSPYGPVCDTTKNLCLCKNDGQCKSGVYTWGNKCDVKGMSCVCQANGDCAGNAHGPTCYKSSSTSTTGKCTCTADAQCKKNPYNKCALPSKYSSYMHCQKPCTKDGDCTDSLLSLCKMATGKCVQCRADNDCSKYSTLKYCLQAKGICVACKSDADCAKNTTNKYCAPSTGKCVSCKNNTHCAKNQFKKTCKVGTGCVECVADANCTVNSLGNKCSGTICVCKTNADCAKQNVGHICDTSIKACSCKADKDCPAGKKCTGKFLSASICQ